MFLNPNNTASQISHLPFNWLPYRLLCILTAEKRTKKMNFPSSSSAARIHSYKPCLCKRTGISVMATSVLSSPCIQNEKASIIMFSISVAHARVAKAPLSVFCCFFSQKRPKRERKREGNQRSGGMFQYAIVFQIILCDRANISMHLLSNMHILE